jgi:hypothetical protein
MEHLKPLPTNRRSSRIAAKKGVETSAMAAEKLLKIIPEFASVPKEDYMDIYNDILDCHSPLPECIEVSPFTRDLMMRFHSYHTKYIDCLMEEASGTSAAMVDLRIRLLNEARDAVYDNVKVYLPDIHWVAHPPQLTENKCEDCGHQLWEDERYRCHDCEQEEREYQMWLWRQEERRYR